MKLSFDCHLDAVVAGFVWRDFQTRSGSEEQQLFLRYHSRHDSTVVHGAFRSLPLNLTPERSYELRSGKRRNAYLSMRRAIISAVEPLKKTKPRTLIESPLLTAVRP